MIELRGITWDHPRGYEPLIASAEPYAQAHGVYVFWEKRSLKDFGDAPIDALAERYDVLIIDHPHAGLAAASGCLLPLDRHIEPRTLQVLSEQSAGLSHQSYTFDGHQWALAIDAAMQTSAYRPDLLEEPLPEGWEDVLALGACFKARARYLGIPLVPTDCICSFLTLCANLGDPPGDAGDILVGEAIGRRALELLTEIAQVAHPESLSWNPIRLLEAMSTSNKVAYCPLTFSYTNYARAGYRPYLVRFHDIPGVKGAILGGTGFAVSARCKYQGAAVAYGLWLCGATTQRGFYLQHGGQPGNLVAWQDEEANRLTNGFFRDTLATLQHAYLRPRHHGFVAFQEAAGNVIHEFLRDRGNVTTCLDRLLELYQQSLGGTRP
jgi:multiple sugar transport system substrate-binding protein